MNNFYILMSPLTGMVGYGGGGTGLTFNAGASSTSIANGGDRGCWYGGHQTSTDAIEFAQIPTAANAQDFGDLLESKSQLDAGSDGSRGVVGGGAGGYNVIQYHAFSSTGNTSDFGDLTAGRAYSSCCANSVKALWWGGWTSQYENVIDKVTISSTGNATDFGDMTVGTEHPGCAADESRGIAAGGSIASGVKGIDYVAIDTDSNASDFGDVVVTHANTNATADATIAMILGGYNQSNIDKITIQTTGNATDWGGDLSSNRATMGVCSNGTRAVTGGGDPAAGLSGVDIMDYFTIASASNATDFGDLPTDRRLLGSASGD